MDLFAESISEGQSLPSRCCALEYRPGSWSSASSGIAQVILLALWDEERQLRILVHPELPAIVQEEDRAYLQSLLLDLEERAKLYPEALFMQLCSLGVGPLVTHAVGDDIEDYPALKAISSTFVRPDFVQL
jgi:hypothetical protein